MNTSQIKNFAAQSRNILKAGVIQRIQILGFDVDGNLTKGEPTRIEIQGGATLFSGEIFDGTFYDRWMSLWHRIQEKGVKEVYEEAAYTWFNRLVAIRIMQKNGFIDPVLAYTNEQTRIPRIVAEARAGRVGKMSPADREKLRDLMGDDARINEQFALLIDNFCRNNAVIFNCFGGIEEYISLLLPDNILAPGGFIDLLNQTGYITDEDYRQSELIGWLYQYYISERKDEVYEGFRSGRKAEAEDIPAATQIFTPNWIVKYMVQNTIGRIYLDNNPWATSIKEQMQYLVESPQSSHTDSILALDSLEDYSLIDPSCGSGHILVEGFGLFYKMYLEEGYASHKAIEKILQKNLLGIDLDTRAKQLATFALLMTAAKIDSSFLDCNVMPRVLDMPGHTFSRTLYELLREFYMGEDREVIDETIEAFRLLEHADNLGPIMIFNISTKTRKEMELRLREWSEVDSSSPVKEVLHSISLILALTDKYTAVVTNPPYMGNSSMNDSLSEYVRNNYTNGKSDLCTTFMLMQAERTTDGGCFANIIPPSWMFLSTFEGLRRHIIDNYSISSLLHLSRGVFGADFGSCSTVIRKHKNPNSTGDYFRLIERTFQEFDQKHLQLLFEKTLSNKEFRFFFADYSKDVTDIAFSERGAKIFYPGIKQDDFKKIPGCPIGYWVGNSIIQSFEGTRIGDFGSARSGMSTTDNTRFLRLWYEVSIKNTLFGCCSLEEAKESGLKWFPYNKGGEARKWYGNNDYVVNWLNDGEEIKYWVTHNPRDPKTTSWSRRIFATDKFFKQGLTWSDITTGAVSCRKYLEGFIFDSCAVSYFVNKDTDERYIMSFLNTKLFNDIMKIINPTFHNGPGAVNKIPLPFREDYMPMIGRLSDECVMISKGDWDAHEISWDFKGNELVRIYKDNQGEGVFMGANRLEDVVSLYKGYWTEQFNQLHTNEEEINRIYLDIFGLNSEMSPSVLLEDVTLLQQGEVSVEASKLVWHNDVLAKQLLSYAVGCMMGRYRLDRPGLHIAYPNPSAADIQEYDFQGEPFEIDDDGIIPLLGHDCPFDDNAYNRVVKFVRQVFGETCLNENLNFIEASLGRTIADYFVKDFWKDHKKMYSNRPIYWLFSSKKGAFQCLTYMHRMNPYTAEAVRSKYLLPYIDSLKGKIAADMERAASLSTIERRNLDKMQAALDECLEYEERLHDVADRQIRFDLDDGVLVNYAKFGDVLAKIK